MNCLIFEIQTLPDLSLAKYETLSDSGVKGILVRHEAFLRQWNQICMLNDMSMHLLYTFDPSKRVGNRINIFLIFQGEENALLSTSHVLHHSPLSDYFTFIGTSTDLSKFKYTACATLIKKERVVPIVKEDNSTQDIYFVPEWTVNTDARMYDLCRMLTAIGTSTKEGIASAYRIDLYPTNLVHDTQNSYQKVVSVLKKLNSYSVDKILLTQNSVRKNRDENTQDIINQFESWIKTLETTPHFRVNIYGFSDNIVHARMLLGSVAAEAIQEGDYSLLKIGLPNEKINAINRMETHPRDYFTLKPCDKASDSLAGWSTTFTYKETAPFFRLPALFDGEAIELPKETFPSLNNEGLLLAHSINGYDVRFPINLLSKHAFVSGVPGAGKTNTMLHIVTSLWKRRIPFLVFEPAKKEYRALFNNPDMSEVLLFSPKMSSLFPIKVNPFEFPMGISLSEHISTLMGVFSGSFFIIGATHYFLDKSIENAYINLGWDTDTVNNGLLPYPTLEDVYALLANEINSSDYDGETKGNLKSFLQVRLGGLMRRDAGQIFNVSKSTLSPEEWLKIPAILELEALGENEKNFLILLLCSLIIEDLRISQNSDEEKEIRHAIFIEEAHNIISTASQQSSLEMVDPKVSATSLILKMLAEVRALKEVIIIADQLPSALAQEVIKNTGLKIIHRLTAKDDREVVGATMSASNMQVEELPIYENGFALLFYEPLQKPFKARICRWGNGQFSYVPMPEFELAKFLYQQQLYNIRIRHDMVNNLTDYMNKTVYPFIDSCHVCLNGFIESKYLIEKSKHGILTIDIEKHRNMHIEKYILLQKQLQSNVVRGQKILEKLNYWIKFPFINDSFEAAEKGKGMLLSILDLMNIYKEE